MKKLMHWHAIRRRLPEFLLRDRKFIPVRAAQCQRLGPDPAGERLVGATIGHALGVRVLAHRDVMANKMRYIGPAMFLAAALFGAPFAHATPITFTTTLTGAAEIPPNGSPATGQATVVLNETANSLGVQIAFSDLLGVNTAARIHCCSATSTAPAAATLLGFPIGVTSGSFSGTYDLLYGLTYGSAFLTAAGSVAQAEAALIAGLEAGAAYVNIATFIYPAGEIRGTLTAVPEPTSLLLLVSALFGLGLVGVSSRCVKGGHKAGADPERTRSAVSPPTLRLTSPPISR